MSSPLSRHHLLQTRRQRRFWHHPCRCKLRTHPHLTSALPASATPYQGAMASAAAAAPRATPVASDQQGSVLSCLVALFHAHCPSNTPAPQTQLVRCPKCSSTLQAPPGAPTFACSCGQVMHARTFVNTAAPAPPSSAHAMVDLRFADAVDAVAYFGRPLPGPAAAAAAPAPAPAAAVASGALVWCPNCHTHLRGTCRQAQHGGSASSDSHHTTPHGQLAPSCDVALLLWQLLYNLPP